MTPRLRHTATTEGVLYQQVAATLRRELASGRHKPGERFASQNELARRFGTNATTAREAVALLVHDGWLTRRFGSGTYVAERAARPAVGIYSAFDFLVPRASPFHLLLPHYLREFLERQGLQVAIYIGGSRPGELQQEPADRRFLDDVENGRLNGVAILSAPDTHGWAQWVRRLAIPAVGDHTPYRVDTRYDEMVRLSVHHLVGQGSRRIALMSWAENGLMLPLREALTECGLDYRAEWVRHDLNPMLSGAGWEEFREIWMACREKPDGLLVMDDVLFDEARIAIQELGLHVPEQLRIVTHANKGAARRYPFPVTEVQLDPERCAATLGGMLLKRLHGEAVEPPTVTLPFEMVEAAPVAAPVAAKTAPRIVPHEVTVGNG